MRAVNKWAFCVNFFAMPKANFRVKAEAGRGVAATAMRALCDMGVRARRVAVTNANTIMIEHVLPIT